MTPFQFLCLFGLMVLVCSKVTVQGSFSRRMVKNTQDSVLFNSLMFGLIAVLLALFFPMGAPDNGLISLAMFGGLANAMFQICYAVALSTGPVSLTVLMINFSVLINVGFSSIAFHEKVFLSQFFGIALLILSFILSIKPDKSGKKVSKEWLVLSILASTFNGCSVSTSKWVAKTTTVEHGDVTYLILTYSIASVIALVFYLIGRLGKKHCTYRPNIKMPLFALAVAAILCLYQKLYIYCMANIDGSVLFPTQSGMSSLGMTTIGLVIFHDKLTKRQLLGAACGVACVFIINLKFGPFVQL